MGDEKLEQAVRRVASILWAWEASGEADLLAASRIVRLVLEVLIDYGPNELEQFDRQLFRLFPNLNQPGD